MALLMPFALLSARLVKKPTVSGTIGKIHGRKKAAKPTSKPKPKVTQREVGSAVAVVVVVSILTESTVASFAAGILLLAMLSSLEPIVVNSISPISAVAVVSS